MLGLSAPLKGVGVGVGGTGCLLMSLTFRAEETRTEEEEETPQGQAAICRGRLREGQVAPQGVCFAPRETVAIDGDGGSGLAFHMDKDCYYCCLRKAEVHRSHGLADLRILGTGCSPHSQHQPTLGSVCVREGWLEKK